MLTLLFAAMFVSVGLLSAHIAVRDGRESLDFSRNGLRAEGRVIGYPYVESGSSKYSRIKPLVRFTTSDGRQVDFLVNVLNTQLPRGTYPVLYKAESPGSARIDMFLTMWMWPSIAAGVAVLMLLIGVPVLVRSLRR